MSDASTTSGTDALPLFVDVKEMSAAAREAVLALVGGAAPEDFEPASRVITNVFLSACQWMLLQLSAAVAEAPEDDSAAAGRAALRRICQLMDQMEQIEATRAGAMQ